jgi:DNA-binding CsgD family transcriptional regulator
MRIEASGGEADGYAREIDCRTVRRPLPPGTSAGTRARRVHTNSAEPPEKRSVLSGREREVLELALVGWSNKRIARRLAVSHRTVEAHRRQILRKTGASNMLELATKSRSTRASRRAGELPGLTDEATELGELIQLSVALSCGLTELSNHLRGRVELGCSVVSDLRRSLEIGCSLVSDLRRATHDTRELQSGPTGHLSTSSPKAMD